MVGRCCLLDAQQRHQGQDAALAVIVDAHGERDIFDGGDDEERPEHQRQRAQHGLRVWVRSGHAEYGLEGVERAGADIAEYDAERRQRQNRQLALRRLPCRFDGNRCRSLAQFVAGPMR